MGSANLVRPLVERAIHRDSGPHSRTDTRLVGALITVTAVHAPARNWSGAGGLLGVGLTCLMRRRAWFLLCCVVIPVIGAGELWDG